MEMQVEHDMHTSIVLPFAGFKARYSREKLKLQHQVSPGLDV